MRILVDIGHPAHVHLFKNLAFKMAREGHEFNFTVREGENETYLLSHYKLDYTSLGRKRKGVIGKIAGLLVISIKMIICARSYKPDLLLSHGSVYAGLAAYFTRKPHIALEDTGNMEQLRLSLPVSDLIITSEYLNLDLGNKQVKYKGFHELAYLHPKNFSPDIARNEINKLLKKNKIILLRFSSWNASHDFNIKGFSRDFKRNLISKLSEFGDIYISSEGELPEEFTKYKLNLSPESLHHLIPYITLYIGEGATTASECAVLGTPAIYYNPRKHDVIAAQESYGLLFHFDCINGILDKAIDILKMQNSREFFNNRRKLLLEENIDLTGFLEWILLNYPESREILKNNPDFAIQFL